VKSTRLLLAFAALPLLLSACTKVPAGDRRVPAASDVQVAFGLDGATKGLSPLTTLPVLAQQDFSVSAWYTPEGETFCGPESESLPYFTNHRFGYLKGADEDDSYANHAWQGVRRTSASLSENPVYYPLDGTLSYFCYAPYREAAGGPALPDFTADFPDFAPASDIALGDPVDDADVIARLPGYLPGSPLLCVTPAASAADQADFLAAPPVLDKSRLDAGGQLSLDFSKHRMTQVEFAFNYKGTLANTADIQESVRVTGITVRDVIGSRYFYFTEEGPYEVGCSWSDAVSPAAPADAAAYFPQASYTLSAAGGDLKTYSLGGLPEASGNNHETVSTPLGILYLLPQTHRIGARLEIAYSIVEQHGVARASEVVSYELAETPAWPEGKRVVYLITLDIPARGVVGLSAVITDWLDAGNSNHPGEEAPELFY